MHDNRREDRLPFPPLLEPRQWMRLETWRDLTRREREVTEMLCQGATYALIQRRLGVTRPTLRTHVRAVYRKFQCRNRTELILSVVHDALLRRK